MTGALALAVCLAAPPAPAGAPAACAAFREPGVLDRGTVDRALDAGLGVWLQRVRVEGVRDRSGRFSGWRVLALSLGGACARLVELRPGDLVVAVNGSAVERPEEAFRVWEDLRRRDRVVVEYVRAGRRGTMRLRIAPAVSRREGRG